MQKYLSLILLFINQMTHTILLYPQLNQNYEYRKSSKDSHNYSLTIRSVIDGYCLINHLSTSQLQLSYQIVSKKKIYPIVFTANNARQLSLLVQVHLMVYNNLTTSHALYLGQELAKSEICLIMQQHYRQS